MIFKKLYLSYIIWTIVILIITIFFLVRLLNVILSPKIIITEPKNFEFRTKLENIIIRGMVKRAYFLRIDDNLIPFNNDGSFEEKISLTQNLNIIKIEAESRFKKKSEKIIKIFYETN